MTDSHSIGISFTREGAEHRYTVPAEGMARLSDVLVFIHRHIDPAFSYRPQMCREGMCFSCLMRVNGRQQLACTTPVHGGQEYSIEPVGEVIADLVTDLKDIAA